MTGRVTDQSASPELVNRNDDARPRARRERLWREVLGQELRRRRLDRRETLEAVALRAAVSLQYLSEVERGAKEPSSEVVAAIATALETTLLDLTAAVAVHLRGDHDGAVASTARGGYSLAA